MKNFSKKKAAGGYFEAAKRFFFLYQRFTAQVSLMFAIVVCSPSDSASL